MKRPHHVRHPTTDVACGVHRTATTAVYERAAERSCCAVLCCAVHCLAARSVAVLSAKAAMSDFMLFVYESDHTTLALQANEQRATDGASRRQTGWTHTALLCPVFPSPPPLITSHPPGLSCCVLRGSGYFDNQYYSLIWRYNLSQLLPLDTRTHIAVSDAAGAQWLTGPRLAAPACLPAFFGLQRPATGLSITYPLLSQRSVRDADKS